MTEDRRPLVLRLLKSLVPPPPNNSLQDSLSREAEGIFASYGLIGAVVVCAAVGYMADWYFDSSPWFLIVSLLVGVGIGFYNLFRAARQH